MKKRSLLTLFLLLLVCVISVQAVNLTSFVRFLDTTDSDVLFYCKNLPNDGKVTINIDDSFVANPGVSTVAELNRPTTVMCIVDTSTAFSNMMHKQAKDVLNIISSRMSDQDSMVIATLGDELIVSDLLYGRDAQKVAIDRIAPKGTTTDLYQAVVDCLTLLTSKTTYASNRILLVLSDGHNDGPSSMTELQAIDAIHSSNIPVYSVSTIDPYPSDYLLKNAKNLTRMSQESIGGLNFIPSVEDMTASNAADKIWKDIQDSTIFTAPIREVRSRSTKAAIQIHYETTENVYDQSFTADLSGLGSPSQPSLPSWTPVDVDTPAKKPAERSNTILYVSIGGGIALLLIVVAVVIVLSQKKKSSAVSGDAQVTTYGGDAGGMQTDMFRGNDNAMETSYFRAPEPMQPQTVPTPAPIPQPAPKPVQHSDVTVRFVALHHSGVNKAIPMATHKAITIGRDSRANVILNPNDKQLSGRHATLEWDGKKLYIRDENSTNGSSLNGVPMKAGTWHCVNEDSKLHLGMYEYRIAIEKK